MGVFDVAVITRQQEQTFPIFMNHESARIWFKEQYGNRFIMKGSELIDGVKMYSYHLVTDRQTYLENWKMLREGKPMKDSSAFLDSYQAIEVFEDGRVHVVY